MSYIAPGCCSLAPPRTLFSWPESAQCDEIFPETEQADDYLERW
jgi:hypothetical protein